MSDLSRLHILEETISRFLSGKTADPGVNTVLDLAETVGLKPYEAFMDATLASEFRVFLELKSNIFSIFLDLRRCLDYNVERKGGMAHEPGNDMLLYRTPSR
jgi:hypothetical protein